MCESNWPAYNWVMRKKRNRSAPANAEKLVYIFCNLRAIRKTENFDLKVKYLARLEVMLIEQHCIDDRSASESLDSPYSLGLSAPTTLHHALSKPSITRTKSNCM